VGADTITQLGVTGRPLLSCLALLRTLTCRGDQLAAAVRSLHDEGLSGDDLVLETWAGAYTRSLQSST